MQHSRCPDEYEIEQYYYGQLSLLKDRLIKSHLQRCSRCSEILEEVKRFDQVFLNVAVVEPPPELSALIMQSVAEAQGQAAREIQMVYDSRGDFRSTSQGAESGRGWRIPWAAVATVAVLLLAFIYNGGFSSYWSFANRDTVIMGWTDLESLLEMVEANVLWITFRQVVAAMKVDLFFTWEILARVLPVHFINVLFCSCLVVVIYVEKVLRLRSGGHKDEETLQI